MSSYVPSLEILEVNYSVSPGGVDTFEVYDIGENAEIMAPPLFETKSLIEACKFCYDLGKDFTVRTFAEWEARELMSV